MGSGVGLFIGFIGLFYIDFSNFYPFNASDQSNFEAITATTTLTFFAFLGMESATIPSDKVNNASQTIKKATIYGTLFTIIIYLMSTISIMGLIPLDDLANSNAPFADISQIISGSFSRKIVAIGAVIATMGALNGWILIQGQIPMSASIDGLFPEIFGKKNSNNSPISGIIISSILISFLLLFNFSKNIIILYLHD